ncbi:MAG: hypothetical protein LBB25_04245 [Holosporaceae bacterium]|jgi:hypothetical protein|nr:hypothetical protein [Holosporaceae bacterium]
MKKAMALSVALLLACITAKASAKFSFLENRGLQYLQKNHSHIADIINENKDTMPIYLEKEVKHLLLHVKNHAILKQLERLINTTRPAYVNALKKVFNIDVYTTAGTIRGFDLLEPNAIAAIDKSNPEIVIMLNERPNDLGQRLEDNLRNLIHKKKIKAILALLEEIFKNKQAPAAAQYSEDEDSEEEMIFLTESENLGQMQYTEEEKEDDERDNFLRVYLNQQAKQILQQGQEAEELSKMQNAENHQKKIEGQQELRRQQEQQELQHQQELSHTRLVIRGASLKNYKIGLREFEDLCSFIGDYSPDEFHNEFPRLSQSNADDLRTQFKQIHMKELQWLINSCSRSKDAANRLIAIEIAEALIVLGQLKLEQLNISKDYIAEKYEKNIGNTLHQILSYVKHFLQCGKVEKLKKFVTRLHRNAGLPTVPPIPSIMYVTN